jgi:hypothetical protein
MRTLLMLAAAAAFSVSVQAQTRSAIPKVKRAPSTLVNLGQVLPEVAFQELPLDQAIEWLKGETRMQIQVRWQTLEDAGIDREKAITLSVKNLSLSQVLWMLMNEAGGTDLKLAYRASGNLLILSTEEDLGKEMIVRVYPVDDLLVRIRRFTAPHVDLQQQSGGAGGGGGQNIFSGSGGGQQEEQETNQDQQQVQIDPEMQQLITLIEQTVHPSSWTVNSGEGTITAFRRMLVVRNNIRVHQELGGPVLDSPQ